MAQTLREFLQPQGSLYCGAATYGQVAILWRQAHTARLVRRQAGPLWQPRKRGWWKQVTPLSQGGAETQERVLVWIPPFLHGTPTSYAETLTVTSPTS